MIKGYKSDEIFEGPLLDNGFVDTKELIEAGLRTEIRLSDLTKIIMGIDGVRLINEISIGNCNKEEPLENEWVICVTENRKPVLCDKSVFSYLKGVLLLNINSQKVKGIYRRI